MLVEIIFILDWIWQIKVESESLTVWPWTKLLFSPSSVCPTSSVNFINILRTNFSYERCFGSFFLVTCTLCVQRSYEKCARITLMKLTAALPCFDIRNITAYSNGASALLRYCEWKGIPISCSAIFTTFPTDQGMCCSFNMKAADEIYVKSAYRDMLQSMQTSDKKASFLPSTVPTYYAENEEPKTIPGRKKGLVLNFD